MGTASPTCVSGDSVGNMYVAGLISGTVSFGSNVLDSSGGTSFILKLNNGTIQYAKRYGGEISSITVDYYGFVYITGKYTDSVDFGLFTLRSINRGTDIFVCKLDSDGKVIWAKSGGGSSNSGIVGLIPVLMF